MREYLRLFKLGCISTVALILAPLALIGLIIDKLEQRRRKKRR